MKKEEAVVQLSRLALMGRRQDIQLFIRRIARQKDFADIKEELTKLLQELPSQSSPTRSTSFGAMPVDLESRLQLLRIETHPTLDYEPIWSPDLSENLSQIINERLRSGELTKAGLAPTKTALFVGKPGVGKTMTARWLARELKLPLLILDLSAVMSSYLGRTGTNLRMVLDYAKSVNCVLLLDEIDAIAKRRDDAAEIGELKRLVTVLLQEVDDWPADSLMVAATNHPDLLDPAVWRRFEAVINFDMPTLETTQKSVMSLLGISKSTQYLAFAMSVLLEGRSYSDIEKVCLRIKRESIMLGVPLEEAIESYIYKSSDRLDLVNKKNLAKSLLKAGYSDRKINMLIGTSRDTLRKLRKEQE